MEIFLCLYNQWDATCKRYSILELNDPYSFKVELPSPKDILCQEWLKLAQWFWRRRIWSMYFRYFVIFSFWKRASRHLNNFNPLHPGMLSAKFGINWTIGFGEEHLISVRLLFRYSPPHHSKRIWPFFWKKMNLLHPRMFCVKYDWAWPSCSGEKDENVKSLQRWRRTTKKFRSEKLTWAYGCTDVHITFSPHFMICFVSQKLFLIKLLQSIDVKPNKDK